MYVAVFFVAVLGLCSGYPSQPKPTCGYESCPKGRLDKINLHIVPHTHNDVGWLKTYDQYYYGSRTNIQSAGVQYIIDSVVQELLKDPTKRFIYVETSYLYKWWKEQDDIMKQQVRQLVNSGRLEIIGGGWCMNDEAAAHYHSIIDQMTWGFRLLDEMLGECARPKIGWQIDPFGHSKENAALFAGFGFDGLFLGRIDWEDKTNREEKKTMEVIWNANPFEKGDDGKLFTSVLYNTYSPPPGFCFDINCDDEPIIDNKESPDYNAEERTRDFLKIMENYTKAYRTENILVTMGNDFNYQNAHINFKNMDKLIKQINLLDTKYYAFYSTPSCYLKSVHEAGITFSTKNDDFLPYSTDPYTFWSGYFSSRPAVKRFERMGNNFLQVVKQISSASGTGETNALNELREALGTLQHHDAVTGTEKEHVAADYARILTSAIDHSGDVVQEALMKIMKKQDDLKTELQSCLLLNISSCEPTEKSKRFVVTLYNPLSHKVDYLVKIPVAKDSSYTVLSPRGDEVLTQMLVVPEQVLDLPGRPTKAEVELSWLAKDIPALGFASYHVTKRYTPPPPCEEIVFRKIPITLGYKDLSLTLNSEGDIKGIKAGRKQYQYEPINNDFRFYIPAVGNNEVFINRSSGAYIFRPNGSEIVIDQDTSKLRIYQGPLVTEMHQTYNEWVSQVIRIVNGSPIAEFQWLVGPIPIERGVGKEIVWHLTMPNMKTGGVFETDSNGRQHLKRKLNHREDWDLHLAEKVPGNYFPITTDISISDHKKVTVITDRTQGGSSLADGELELMVHRRLTHDDAFGVGEALNETAFGEGLIVRGSHWLLVDDCKSSPRKEVQELSILPPWIFISTTSLSFAEWEANFLTTYSSLLNELPENVQILTFEPWAHNSILLRLEHIGDPSSDPKLAVPVTIDLENLFSGLEITGIQEMSLGANMKKSEVSRLSWKSECDNKIRLSAEDHRETFRITVQPMQIKTFLLQVK
ncbi:unnamed protein product [Nezara viridula]|uniref:Alpha-mannosidase n=1 Tax=Nezara viridula TaxID=85310 RepID=A0A9P0HPV2_NEZVI|nr:unnamed protein product [Nezara viridula]